MTDSNSRPHPDPQPATQRQLSYLRSLAVSRGQTFVVPGSKAEASREIERLRAGRRSSHADRAAERFDARQIAERLGPATAVHPSEVEGHGSSARWRRGG
jgi:hypothetical protein